MPALSFPNDIRIINLDSSPSMLSAVVCAALNGSPAKVSVSALKGAIVVDIEGDVSALQGDVSALQGDVSALQGDVSAQFSALKVCFSGYSRFLSWGNGDCLYVGYGSGVSFNGSTLYDLKTVSLQATISSLAGFVENPVTAGWKNIFVCKDPEGNAAVRVSPNDGVGDGYLDRCFAGNVLIKGDLSVGAFKIEGGIYQGYLGGTGITKTVVMDSGASYGGGFTGFVLSYGQRLKIGCSNVNRFAGNTISYNMPDYIDDVCAGINWQSTAPSVSFEFLSLSSGTFLLKNNTTSQRTLYLWPIEIHYPLICRHT